MAGGGLLTLVATGPQDVGLTGDPQVTYFKSSYHRYAPFSSETRELTWTGGTPQFNNSIQVILDRSGDMIGEIWLNMNLSMDTSANEQFKACWQKEIGYRVLDRVSFEIGGNQTDEMVGNWMIVWHELNKNDDHSSGWDKMVGNSPAANELSYTSKATQDKQVEVYVPLMFYFNQYRSLALPLVALQYHDVKLQVHFREAKDCIQHDVDDVVGKAVTVKPNIDSCRIVGQYYFLGEDERTRVAQSSATTLMFAHQNPNGPLGVQTTSSNLQFDLSALNHPCKCLVWTTALEKYTTESFLGNDLVSATKAFIFRYGVDATVAQAVTATGESAISDDTEYYPLSVAADESVFSNSVTIQDIFNTAIYRPSGVSSSLNDWKLSDEWNRLNVNVLLDIETASKSISELDDLYGKDNTISNLTTNGTAVKLNADIYGANLDGSGYILEKGKIMVNGHALFEDEPAVFFNSVMPCNKSLNAPEDDGINVYSWALKPADYQPTGTCNFSRMDTAKLSLHFKSDYAKLSKSVCAYVINYNQQRVMSGMSGLMFSN